MALQKWELPTTVTKRRAFLGVTNFYSRYLPRYAKYSALLTSKLQLSREDGKKGSQKVLKWTVDEIGAFKDLKKALTDKL